LTNVSKMINNFIIVLLHWKRLLNLLRKQLQQRHGITTANVEACGLRSRIFIFAHEWRM